MKGRTPDHPAVKALKNKTGRSATGQGQNSTARSGPPPCPDHLDELARDEWYRLAPILWESGGLTAADGSVLAIYCAAFGRWRRASDELESDGPVLNTDLGGSKAHPAAAIVAKAESTMLRILSELGGTPGSRLRMGPPQEPEQDKLAEFLTGKP